MNSYEIAHVLNANLAPLALVLDFADELAEKNSAFDRQGFVRASTQSLYNDSTRAVAGLVLQRS